MARCARERGARRGRAALRSAPSRRFRPSSRARLEISPTLLRRLPARFKHGTLLCLPCIAALASPRALCKITSMDLTAQLRSTIRDVPDFPKAGIVFKDITPVLSDGRLFRSVIDRFAEELNGLGVTKIVGIDARGFIFAGAVACKLGLGFIPIRKKGKLPWTTRSAAYKLEYGEAVVEMHVVGGGGREGGAD